MGSGEGTQGEEEAEQSEFCVQVSDLAGRFLPVLVAPMVSTANPPHPNPSPYPYRYRYRHP